jgi:hypothetical protein
MAWFSDTTNAPKIQDGVTYYDSSVTYTVGTPGDTENPPTTQTVKVPIRESQFRFVGLTNAAADSIAGTYTEDSSGEYTAASERMNDAAGYMVRVTRTERNY